MSRRTLLVIVLVLAALPAFGQDGAGPWRFLFFVETTVAPADGGAWAQAVGRTAAAHREHENGNTWAAFRRLTGGPEEVVSFFFPLDRMADLDRWRPNRRILVEAVGKEQARIALGDLELGTDSVEGVQSYAPGLSLPGENATADAPPPTYYWLERVSVKDDRMSEYVALAKRVKDAYEKQPGGLRWLVYGHAIGGNKNELVYYYGFGSFAEIDTWPSKQDVLSATIGEEEAIRLLAAIEDVAETTTSLWQLEPGLSQLGGE